MNKINEAILAIQKEIKALSKDQENPFFKSNYFDINNLLEELTPLLVKNGLAVMQPLTNIDGKPAIATILSKEDERQEYVMPLPEGLKPQEMGAAITYYRRYTLQSTFLLRAEDNDGNETNPDAGNVKPKFSYNKKPKGVDRNDDF